MVSGERVCCGWMCLGAQSPVRGEGRKGRAGGRVRTQYIVTAGARAGSRRVQATPAHRVAADHATFKVDVRALHTIIDDVHAHAHAR